MAVHLGLGYAKRPLELGDSVCAKGIQLVIRKVMTTLSDPRYRPSPRLARRAQFGMSLRELDTCAS
nr:hypothetical protein [Caballeronia sp. LZ029]